MRQTIIGRFSVLLVISQDALALIGTSDIQPVAKAKTQSAKASIDSLKETLEGKDHINYEERLTLLDTVCEQLTAATSSMNPNGVQYAARPFTGENYEAVSQLIDGVRDYCNQNGIAFAGVNNPFAQLVRQLHLTLAKAGESKVMWQQIVLQAFEQLIASVRNTVRTQEFAGAEYEIAFREFAPSAIEGAKVGTSQWASARGEQPTSTKAPTARRELAGVGAQG